MTAAICTAIPALLLLVGLAIALATHPYAAKVGWRYLRSKKRRTVSVITFIAVSGVALGVAALLAVTSITSGFQDEFRNKVLGVNAHVLVLKYGLDFEEYRMVIERAREMPEVAGAAPFLINEMMLANGDRIGGVLVKGVDPELMPTVLDLPSQMIQGNLRGLRAPGAAAPTRPEDLLGEVYDEWDWLNEMASADGGVPLLGDGGVFSEDAGPAARSEAVQPDAGAPDAGAPDAPGFQAPPTPEEAEAALAELEEMELPDDDIFDQMIDEDELELEEQGEPITDLPGIIVGTTLAQNLGLGVGDRVQVISPLAGLDVSMWTSEGSGQQAPRSREFRVIGIFEAGFQEYDARLVYVDLFEAQHFFNHCDSVTGVEITLHDLEEAPQVSRRLERVLGGGPYHTMDWQELNHNLFTALEIQKVMLSLVIASIIFVAAFNVIATLIMIVLEKKREIAILKAMGARSFGVLLIFIVQGLLIGLVGTAIGLLLGGSVCLYLEYFEFPLDPHVYLIDHLPVRTSFSEFITTISVAVVICISATVIPSWWAARLLPADGVRYE